MEEKFWAAVDVIKSIPYDGTFEPSEEMLLKLYALEKQATVGPCCTEKPYVWNISGRSKWMAWNSLGCMSKHEAMAGYIEELSKVVETMSYNEKISKFISLMGPFYEIVTSEESEKGKSPSGTFSVLDNYTPPTISELYHLTKNNEQDTFFSRPEHLSPRESELLKSLQCSQDSFSSSSSSSDISDYDLLSDLSGTGTDSSGPEVIPEVTLNVPSSKSSQSLLSKRDILGLAFINLQTSMDEILKKVNNVHSLAESADLRHLEPTNENEKWSLNLTTTAFAFLWPVACTAMLESL